MERRPAGQGNHAPQSLLAVEGRIKSQRPALGETAQHDSLRGNAGLHLLLYQHLHQLVSLLNANLVLLPCRIQRQEIEPGGHLEARVKRYRHLAGSRTDNFHMRRSAIIPLLNAKLGVGPVT